MTSDRASAPVVGTRRRAEPISGASHSEFAVGILVAVTNPNDKPWGNAGAILSWGKGKPVQLGVFIPIGNNGWLISTTSPQYKPSFDLNREVVQKAERFGFDFALSMIKLHGFGGPSRYWDYNLESFTLMAGLAAVTNRIRLFATCAVLTLPPPIAARMAVTIDSISGGRFGINIISGWQRREYTQMGVWPGAEHYKRRYQ